MPTADDRLWRDARLSAGKAGGVAIAKRYSGDACVTMIYRDATSDYACRVTSLSGSVTIIVAAPTDIAVDGRDAFDKAARAAILFALHDGFDAQAESDEESGRIKVTGKPPARRTP